jgi:4-amino-4-deoxy-L-arabinose transferase-like glycosyltransferase
MRALLAGQNSSTGSVRWFGWLETGLPLLVLLAVARVGLWPNLDHPAIARWDEAVHQLATRELHDTGVPTVYPEPLVPYPFSKWTEAHIFIHKPPLPFAMAALLMWIVGAAPVALRLVSLAAAFAAAAGLYWFGRRVVGAALALILAVAFLALPFGFRLVQGYQFGDVTDVSLLGFLTLSLWVLYEAVERDSSGLAAVAGALCGCAYLCKSALALLPLGVAGGLASLGALGLAPRLRFRLLFWFVAAAIVVALPWNLYSALKWPDLYRWEANHTLGFLTDRTRPEARPVDALFNELNERELAPWPVAIFPLAGLWLLWAAWKRRTTELWLLCLWLWGEWIPLTIAVVKVPAHGWGVIPAELLAVGLLLRDSLKRPWLAAAALGALLSKPIASLLPQLALVRRAVPKFLVQTAARPGLAEGVVLLLLFGMIGFALTRLLRHWPLARLAVGGSALLLACWIGLGLSAQAMRLFQLDYRDTGADTYGDDLGRILDRELPPNAMLFLSTRDPACCLGKQELMFFSRRMTYPAQERLVELARANGFHPYLVSGLAQPFARVQAVPANVWLHAFDLDAPQVVPDATLPEGVTPADVTLGAQHVLGVAVGRGDSTRDRYVLYLRAQGPYTPLTVSFYLDDGSVEHEPIPQRRALDWPMSSKSKVQSPPSADRPWFTDPTMTSWYELSVPGPLRSRLRSLQLNDLVLPLPWPDLPLVERLAGP